MLLSLQTFGCLADLIIQWIHKQSPHHGSPRSPPHPWGWCGFWARTPAEPEATVHPGSLQRGTDVQCYLRLTHLHYWTFISIENVISYTLDQTRQNLKTLHPLQTPRQQSSRSHPRWWWASAEHTTTAGAKPGELENNMNARAHEKLLYHHVWDSPQSSDPQRTSLARRPSWSAF